MVEITSTGRDAGGKHNVTFSGLTTDEFGKVEGCVRGGHRWMRVFEGEVQFVESYEPLPNPTQDEGMLPFWRSVGSREVSCTPEFNEFDDLNQHSSVSISIQHLCGYYYSKDNYRKCAEILESYGFICMRSKREDDGRFHEIWLLPSLCFARGELSDLIHPLKDEKEKRDEAVRLLCRTVQFGTLDVSIQRAAMVMTD